MIIQFVQPFGNLGLECTYIVPPASWRDLLFRGTALPWLWDLDRECLSKPASLSIDFASLSIDRRSLGSESWDWELLVRQLGQANSFNKGQIMYGALPGLRNRRRIWRLLSEMRLGDMYDLRTKYCSCGPIRGWCQAWTHEGNGWCQGSWEEYKENNDLPENWVPTRPL